MVLYLKLIPDSYFSNCYKYTILKRKVKKQGVALMKKKQEMNAKKRKVFQDKKEEMTINDYLSVERTRLSIERTHLSYMRTVVSMVVAGITLYKLVSGWEGILAATILMVSAIYFYIRGKKVCNETDRNLRYVEDEDD